VTFTLFADALLIPWVKHRMSNDRSRYVFPGTSRTGVQLDVPIVDAEIPAGTRGTIHPAVFGSREFSEAK
jgi:hypothetical protein